MKEKMLTLVIFFVTYSSSYGQQNIVFADDFAEYLKDWKLVNTKEFTVSQDSGVLSFKKKTNNRINNGCLWYKRTISNFYADRDFSIAFTANSLSSESASHLFDFQWGKMQEYDGIKRTVIYQLDFTLNKVRLGRFELHKGWKYYSWSNETTNPLISRFILERDSFNIYEIIQQEKLLIVKINAQVVYITTIEPLPGSEIGCLQGFKGEWQLDNLIIKH